MSSNKKPQKREGYSLNEIKNKYLPSRDIKTLEQEETPVMRDTFLDMLKRVNRPDQALPAKDKAGKISKP
jgi:hypothetical protein